MSFIFAVCLGWPEIQLLFDKSSNVNHIYLVLSALLIEGLCCFWPVIITRKPLTNQERIGSPQTNEFAGHTNNQLRQRVITFAREMRVFESDYKAKRPQMEPLWGSTQQEIRENWSRHIAQSHALSEAEKVHFRNNFLGEARSLRDELSKRLGISTVAESPTSYANMEENMVAHTLKFGMLAGPSPVSDIADYLEKLARALP